VERRVQGTIRQVNPAVPSIAIERREYLTVKCPTSAIRSNSDTKELKIANVVYGKEAEELYEKVTGKPQVNKSLLTSLDGILSKETGGKF
jgi:hypothetical protein